MTENVLITVKFCFKQFFRDFTASRMLEVLLLIDISIIIVIYVSRKKKNSTILNDFQLISNEKE